MNETRRYHEPKILGDILKDMNMDTESINKQRTIQGICKNFATDFIKNMERYGQLFNVLYDTYTYQVTDFVTSMDTYFTDEKTSFSKNQKKVEQGRMTQQDINNKLQIIERNLDTFEEEFQAIKKLLRTTIDQFEDKEDRHTETLKSNDFHKLFIDIYTDIDNLRMDYERLLRRAPRT